MTTAASESVAEQRQRELARELLEAKIHLRVCRLEVAAARLWLQLVKASDSSPVGWLRRADYWPPAAHD